MLPFLCYEYESERQPILTYCTFWLISCFCSTSFTSLLWVPCPALSWICTQLKATKTFMFNIVFLKVILSPCTIYHTFLFLSFVLPGSFLAFFHSPHSSGWMQMKSQIVVTGVCIDESVCLEEFCYHRFLWKSFEFHVEVVGKKQSKNLNEKLTCTVQQHH